MNIHEDHTADKDHADLPANEVLEHGDMVDQIKGLWISLQFLVKDDENTQSKTFKIMENSGTATMPWLCII